LPDRPGALGAVASRIGSVRGDLVGIEILERGAGRAIDELVVVLPDDELGSEPERLIDIMSREIGQVDGVDVEEVRELDSAGDPRLDALETAALLVGAADANELLGELCRHASRCISASWTVVVEVETGVVRAMTGDAPDAAWLSAFIEGSRESARLRAGAFEPEDVIWAPMPSAQTALVIGREGTAFRAKERRQAAALARIADSRFRSITEQSALTARLAHPSRAPQSSAQSAARSTARFHPS
jgi:hypothetical protein